MSCYYLESEFAISGYVFCKGVNIGCARILLKKEQGAVSKHSHSGNDVWMLGSGVVFEETGILSPVISNLYAAPVFTCNLKPLFW